MHQTRAAFDQVRAGLDQNWCGFDRDWGKLDQMWRCVFQILAGFNQLRRGLHWATFDQILAMLCRFLPSYLFFKFLSRKCKSHKWRMRLTCYDDLNLPTRFNYLCPHSARSQSKRSLPPPHSFGTCRWHVLVPSCARSSPLRGNNACMDSRQNALCECITFKITRCEPRFAGGAASFPHRRQHPRLGLYLADMQ